MGKGKRTKGTKVALGDFIGESSGNTVNVGGKTVEMPSAPRASTLEIDVSQLPSRPPYTAIVANLAYDVTEDDLFKFFESDGIELHGVHIPRDDDSGDRRFKGIAYVTVDGPKAVDSLAHVLAKSDHLLLNRKVKIDIYQERGSKFGDRPGRRGFGEGREQDPNSGRSDANDDWRRGGNDDRGGFDRRDDRRGYDDRRGGDRYDDRRGGYDRHDDRRGGGYDRYDDRRGSDRYGDRGGDRYGERRDYGDRDRYGGGRDDFGRGGYNRSAADDDSSWRRSAPEIPERRDVERRDVAPRQAERPRLQLQKRTVSKDGESSAAKSTSIFGAAKPIDTTKKEKEIEEKLKRVDLNIDRNGPRREEKRREEKPRLTAEDRAAAAEIELKKRVEHGIDDARPECDREQVGQTSRFALLEDDE